MNRYQPNPYHAEIEELRKLGYIRRSMAYLRGRIDEKTAAKYTINSGTASAVPTSGGGTKYEDRLDNLIVDCDGLSTRYAALWEVCCDTEMALAALERADRLVLELCYVERPSDWVAAVRNKLHVEQSQVYKIKDRALERFAVVRRTGEWKNSGILVEK